MFAARKSEPAKKPICAILHFFHPVLKEWARACQSASGDAGVCSGGAGGAQQPVASLQMTTAARRCAGPMAARVMLAAPPVLPDGGRPVGTARKNFESITLSSPCRPQRRQGRALRRAGSVKKESCGGLALFAARKSEPAKKPICAVLHFFHPALKGRAGACQSAFWDAAFCSGGTAVRSSRWLRCK